MSTRYYGLPTVDDSATMTFVDSVNGLANSTDAVLHGVAESFDKQAFDLPTATSETLGGVRIGDGFKIYSDGLLTTSNERFTLSPAKETSIGGVAIGKNMTVTDAGAIGVGDGAFKTGEITGSQLATGAVTTDKLGGYAVEAPSQISTDLYNKLTGFANLWKNPTYKLGWKRDNSFYPTNYVYKLGDYYFSVTYRAVYEAINANKTIYVDNLNTPATPDATGIENLYIAWGELGYKDKTMGIRDIAYCTVDNGGNATGSRLVIDNSLTALSTSVWYQYAVPLVSVFKAM